MKAIIESNLSYNCSKKLNVSHTILEFVEFDSNKTFYRNILPSGCTINREYYLEVVNHFLLNNPMETYGFVIKKNKNSISNVIFS